MEVRRHGKKKCGEKENREKGRKEKENVEGESISSDLFTTAGHLIVLVMLCGINVWEAYVRS